jgi:hypothetical protein
VVGEGLQGLLGHGVHGVRDDEVADVHRVAVVGVLHAGRGPQGTLHVGAGVLERQEPVTGELLLERLVGQPGVGDAGQPHQVARLGVAGGVEPLVDLAVHPGDEEGRHRVDLREVLAGCLRLLQALEVGVHDGVVALQPEDQRDVHADALGQHLGDRRGALGGRRDLDQQVLPVHLGPQLLGHLDGGLLVVGHPGGDLDRHATVQSSGGLEGAGEDVTGLAYVGGGDREDRVVDVLPGLGELAHLVVVPLTVGQRAREDGRVGGDAHHRALLHEVGEVPGLDPLAGQVVEPDGDPCVSEGLESFGHRIPSGCFVVEWCRSKRVSLRTTSRRCCPRRPGRPPRR